MNFPFEIKNRPEEIIVNASSRYRIRIGENFILDELEDKIRKYDSAFLITDTNLANCQQENISKVLEFPQIKGKFILKAGEREKNWKNLDLILTEMLKSDLNRNSLLIAFGGGVVGDIAGLAASLFMRGIDCHMVPTTLLAMVDSSVGGKTGINHPSGKNLIGTFHQPAEVTIDISFLKTLPEREFLAGMAEVIKYGYIFDRNLLTFVNEKWEGIGQLNPDELTSIISYCCQAKSLIVEKDEFENDLRMLLNLGHTFGHAIETFFNYEKILHGEAINIGMVLANEMAEEKGMVDSGFSQNWFPLHAKLGMDEKLIDAWSPEVLSELMTHDKKRGLDGVRLILPANGTPIIYGEATTKELANFWEKMKPELLKRLKD